MMRTALVAMFVLLLCGLARVGIAVLWITWWIGFCIGAIGVSGCISSFIGRDALADYIERQGFKRPRGVSESRLY